MSANRILAASAALLIAAGCSTTGTYQPIVDHEMSKPRQGASYQDDLAECRALAAQRSPGAEATGGAIAGAVLGAIVGGLLGAYTGDAGQYAAQGAGLGAVGGAADVGGSAMADQQVTIRNCLAGRGWAVVGR